MFKKTETADFNEPKGGTMEDNRNNIPESEGCGHDHCNEALDRDIRLKMPAENALYDLAEFYKVFGDSTRIRILYALFESSLCVCDIAGTLEMTVSAVSHQLKILKQARLVKCIRDGKSMIYELADDHVKTILGQGMEHISE